MNVTGLIIGTTPTLIAQTPPNYSIIIDDLYVGNPTGSLSALTLYAVPYTYNASNPPATSTVLSGSILITNLPVQNTFVAVNEKDALRLPTGVFIYAVASAGSISLTYNSRYVYFRE